METHLYIDLKIKHAKSLVNYNTFQIRRIDTRLCGVPSKYAKRFWIDWFQPMVQYVN